MAKVAWCQYGPQTPVGAPSKLSLALSVTQSCLSDRKDDNELSPRAMHRTPEIYLKAEENPEKRQLGDR